MGKGVLIININRIAIVYAYFVSRFLKTRRYSDIIELLKQTLCSDKINISSSSMGENPIGYT